MIKGLLLMKWEGCSLSRQRWSGAFVDAREAERRSSPRAFSRDDAVSSGNLTLLPTDATLSVAASPEDDNTAARALSASFFFFFFIACNLEQRGDPIRPCHQPFDETALCASTFAVLMPNQLVGQTSDHDATYIACSTVEFAIQEEPTPRSRIGLCRRCSSFAPLSRRGR